MTDEPIPEELQALDAEVSHAVYATEHDALHGWMAVTQLPISLGLRSWSEGIVPTFGDLAPYCDVPWVLDEMQKHPYPSDEASRFIDKLGDASKVLLAALQDTLTERGIGNAELLVYLPCHRGYGAVRFSTEHGPAVRVF